jgi:serine protease Do
VRVAKLESIVRSPYILSQPKAAVGSEDGGHARRLASPGGVPQGRAILQLTRNKPSQAVAGAARRPVPVHWVFLSVLTIALALVWSAQSAQARGAPDSFADLAARLSPSVVNISTTQKVNQPSQPEFQVPPGSPFEDFFKEFFDRNRRPQQQRKMTSLGSGFIIDADGLVVTNNHVVAEADEISVRLPDGSQFDAELVGRDPKTDLALLRFKPDRKLNALTWGDSNKARVGDWVLAIGNPFGLGGSVTAGIVSARGRDINAGPYDDFIQTDASINRGNSGGPLFNMDGQVIGINTAIFSPTGGSVGIGFAIPSSLAQNVIAQLNEFGRTRRGWLGVRIQTVTEEIAEGLGLKNAEGALVAGVTEGGPAEKHGLQQGDVILKFDGKTVDEMRALPRIVAETPIGKEVKVQIWRKGKMETLGVMIGEMDETPQAMAEANGGGGDQGSPAEVEALGMRLSAITPEMRERFELDEAVKGVMVVEVAEGGAAAEKGIRPGDVIVEVQQDVVGDPGQVKTKVEEVKKAGRKSVLLLLRQRAGDLRFVAVRIDDAE